MAPKKKAVSTQGRTISTEVDESLIPDVDVEPDQVREDPNYDTANDEVDPETVAHEVDMGDDPGEPS